MDIESRMIKNMPIVIPFPLYRNSTFSYQTSIWVDYHAILC